MVRLEPGQRRASTTTRRVDLRQRSSERSPEPAGALLRAVLDHGPAARSTLARVVGASASSVSSVASTLLDHGLIREAPEAAGPPGFGRPHVPLDLDTTEAAVAGIHFAVPHATVALLDLRGRVLASRRLPYVDPSPEEAVLEATRAIDALCEGHEGRRVLGVGVATGGWVDSETGVVVEHPVLEWRSAPLRQMVSAASGLTTYVENHGRALIAAEQLFGAHADKARESIVHLFVGNVVDAAFATRGQVHQGSRSASGSVAHLQVDLDADPAVVCRCGRLGCLEPAVSEVGLLRRAGDLGVDAGSIRDLVARTQDGDARVVELFVERSRLVGRAAACLIDLFSPEVLTVVEAGFLWVPEAREALLAEVGECSEVVERAAETVVATSFADPLAVAGGAVFLDRLYAAPLASLRALSTAS